jgi:predicted RNA polymerase sigma factor
MRTAVLSRRLRDIEAAQEAEIAALKAEVERLERRTFPRFPEPVAAAGGAPGELRGPPMPGGPRGR